METKRISTAKTRIKAITAGRFAKGEGFNPSFVLTNLGQKLARVRIIATVVNKFLSESGKFAAITIDDGTDTIRAKVFNAVSVLENINEGDDIDMIARIKEYQAELYLVPEVIQKVTDPNMEILRELELNKHRKELEKRKKLVIEYKAQVSDLAELTKIMNERFGISPDDVEAILQTEEMGEQEEPKEKTDTKSVILKLVEDLDQGTGCDYAELIEASGLDESVIDAAVNDLLSEGTCFEPKPGRIKKL